MRLASYIATRLDSHEETSLSRTGNDHAPAALASGQLRFVNRLGGGGGRYLPTDRQYSEARGVFLEAVGRRDTHCAADQQANRVGEPGEQARVPRLGSGWRRQRQQHRLPPRSEPETSGHVFGRQGQRGSRGYAAAFGDAEGAAAHGEALTFAKGISSCGEEGEVLEEIQALEWNLETHHDHRYSAGTYSSSLKSKERTGTYRNPLEETWTVRDTSSSV